MNMIKRNDVKLMARSQAAQCGLSPEYMARCIPRKEPPTREEIEWVMSKGARFSVESTSPDGGLSFRHQIIFSRLPGRDQLYWYRSIRARIQNPDDVPETHRLEQEFTADLRTIGAEWRIETWDGWPLPWPGAHLERPGLTYWIQQAGSQREALIHVFSSQSQEEIEEALRIEASADEVVIAALKAQLETVVDPRMQKFSMWMTEAVRAIEEDSKATRKGAVDLMGAFVESLNLMGQALGKPEAVRVLTARLAAIMMMVAASEKCFGDDPAENVEQKLDEAEA